MSIRTGDTPAITTEDVLVGFTEDSILFVDSVPSLDEAPTKFIYKKSSNLFVVGTNTASEMGNFVTFQGGLNQLEISNSTNNLAAGIRFSHGPTPGTTQGFVIRLDESGGVSTARFGDKDGAILMAVVTNGAGKGLWGIGVSPADAMLEIETNATTEEGLHIKASASQTGDLFITTDESDNSLFSIENDGIVEMANGTNEGVVFEVTDSAGHTNAHTFRGKGGSGDNFIINAATNGDLFLNFDHGDNIFLGTDNNTHVTIGSTISAADLDISHDAIGASIPSSNSGMKIRNGTAAAAGAQQWSPGQTWSARGWKTDATAASVEVQWQMFIDSEQGTAAPDTNWRLQGSNGGAFVELFKMNYDTGNLTIANGGFVSSSASANSTFAGDLTVDKRDVLRYAHLVGT